MRRIGLLGGTFDPIHNGHLAIAKHALQKYQLDFINFIPTTQHAFKGTIDHIDVQHRIRLIELATEENPKYVIDHFEINSDSTNYTIDYVENLDHHDTEYFFLIGMDNLPDLHRWHRIDDLMKLVTFICLTRPDYTSESSDFLQKYEKRILFDDEIQIDIASTQIREMIKQKKSTKDFLPESLRDYIESEQLYR